MRRSALRIALVVTLLLCALLPLATAAVAAPRLEVTPAKGLDPAGEKVFVRGEGYDERKGIYVAWCVVPEKGAKPTPCGGGQDRDGSSGSSVWISSFPPAYGVGLAEGYDEGGSFEVEILVSRYIGEVDCFEVACAVTTRNDHERSEDRSQDVFAPVSFRGQRTAARSDHAPAARPAKDDSANPRAGGADGAPAHGSDPARTGAATSSRGSAPAAGGAVLNATAADTADGTTPAGDAGATLTLEDTAPADGDDTGMPAPVAAGAVTDAPVPGPTAPLPVATGGVATGTIALAAFGVLGVASTAVGLGARRRQRRGAS